MYPENPRDSKIMKREGDVKHEDWEKLGTRVHPYCRFLQHPSCQQATVLNDSVLPDPVHLIHKEGNVRNKKRKVKRHKKRPKCKRKHNKLIQARFEVIPWKS